jgi:hypothetical protein
VKSFIRIVGSWAVASAACFGASVVAAAEPAGEALVVPLDPEMLQRRNHFGFSAEEIERHFGKPFVMPMDRTGLDRTMLKPPPAPGVHPRVLFNPEDVPALRTRLTTTKAGRHVMGKIRQQLERQLDDPNGTTREKYEQLIAGDDSGSTELGSWVLYECFRCLVDDDAEGGKRAAAAVTTLAKIAAREIEANVANLRKKGDERGARDFRLIAKGPTVQGTLGLMYDFTHQWMTEEQRRTVRAALAKATNGVTMQGAETLHALQTNASNWISWTARMLFVAAAIEGEEGSDPLAYRRAADAMTGYVGAYFDTGEAFEGWGKNFTFIEHLAIMAKRGDDTIAAAHFRNSYRQYFVHAMSPWGPTGNGGAFTFYDSQGGTGNNIARNADVMGYKFFYPSDPAADWIYRNQIAGNYANLTEANGVNIRHPFGYTDALVCAIYANDFDDSRTWEQARAAVTQGRPLALFSQDTNNLIARSSWEPDAVYLNYLNRAVPGGHIYSDRSHFSIYADGRYWGVYRSLRQIREQFLPDNRSVVMNESEGPQTLPGRCVGYADTPQATLIATDLKPAWDYVLNRLTPPEKRPSVWHRFSFNDFRLEDSPKPWMDLPIVELPDWYNSEKPTLDPGRGHWHLRENPVSFAYRTAGLVRGPRPYVLIVDDLKRGTSPSRFTWNMTVAGDVEIASAQASSPRSADVLLTESKPDAGGRRNLLVRVLDADQLDTAAPATIEIVRQPNAPQPDVEIPKLVIPARTTAPGYKVLLFPHREGQPLPTTTWSADRTTVTVAWPDQTDVITFAPGTDGRTRVRVARGAATLAELK